MNKKELSKALLDLLKEGSVIMFYDKTSNELKFKATKKGIRKYLK